MPRVYFYSLLALMVGCGTVVLMGHPDSDVSLESARAIWADTLRDADAVGLQATRVSPAREMQLGDEMAAQIVPWGQEDPEATRYVGAVAASLIPHAHRQDIRFHIHVIRSAQVNAFALPGGHIYVLTGLLDFLQSEAELAAILGHEISHVDLRHCIERYQYQLALRRFGAPEAGEIAGIAHALVAFGYTQDQELEADAAGEQLAIEAGYDPDAAVAVFNRMQTRFGGAAHKPASTPADEAAGAVIDAIGSYFRTHPPSHQRAVQLSDLLARNHRELAGRIVYKGVRNFQSRIPRGTQELPDEKHIY